jgi:hypothetical protein
LPEQSKATVARDVAIGPAYREGLLALLDHAQHARLVVAAPGQITVTAQADGVSLTVNVDLTSHVVVDAGHAALGSDVQRGLCEALCLVAIGRPILEVGEHAAILIEFRMRDRSMAPPVLGIVHPDNADPLFQLPKRLARRLLQVYRQKTGYDELANFYDAPSSSEWRALSSPTQYQKVGAAIATIEVELGMAPATLTLLGVSPDGKVILDFDRQLPNSAKSQYLRRIEQRLKATIESTLCIYSVERKDLNKIRRL